jgi:hypothetical protein
MMDLSPSDPFTGISSTASLDEIGSEDDLFLTYIDMDRLGDAGADPGGNEGAEKNQVRSRHRHNNLVIGSSLFGETIDGKKAMSPDKLAELWPVDPKCAKRFVILIE